MCNSGNIAAHMTAKIVIASAKRLIDVRQCWWSNNKIAEISVPAWPMPIHQTKLMIAKPQATGMLLPQMPMPISRRLNGKSGTKKREANREGDVPFFGSA